jgi:hypothetical protein
MRLMAASQGSGPVPCLALLGEFSAGKSSIVNLLLGRDMLPTAVLSSTRWPTYVRYAPYLRIEAISERGRREPVSPDAVKTLAREDLSFLDVGAPNELLRHVELLDTPGFADPFHDPERTLGVVESADICIWCTLATQAWRQSERKIWLSLPARFRSGGILVVTHVDSLAHRGEQSRVRARLEREASDLFGDIVLLSVPDAARAMKPDGGIADAELWQDSGGGALVATLQKAVINYHKARGADIGVEEVARAARTGIEFTQTDSFVSPAATPVTARPAPETSSMPPEPAGAEELQPFLAAVPPAATAVVTPAPEASSVPPESGDAEELRRFLATVMETVPACLASAWIDLTEGRVLLFRGPDEDEMVATTALGEAITDLFQGSNVQRIEQLFKRVRGLADDDRRYFQEIVIVSDDCVGIFLRHQSRVDRSLVVVSDRTVNLGMVLAKTRGLLESADLLI